VRSRLNSESPLRGILGRMAGIRRSAAVLAVLVAGSALVTPQAGDSRLATYARVASLYHDTALGFACRETITYRGPTTGRIGFAYIFVHENGRLHDYRTWSSGTLAADRGKEVDPATYHVPRFLASAYLFPFVFREDRQPLHAFYNLGEDEALGRRALKVGFQPKGAIKVGENDWVGTAWFDLETSQFLKVQAWSPADWDKRATREQEIAAAPSKGHSWESDPYEIETVEVEYGVVKNGMRFPSKVTIVQTRSKVHRGERDDPLSEYEILRVTQEYSDYEFFSVRSSEEIRRIVSGDAAPKTRK
jgi:hypothetical protein